MKQVNSISVVELQALSKKMYGSLVKAVVDIQQKIVVVDAEMHVDEEQYLLERGSKQDALWGINLHPSDYGTDAFIEFDSMINIRPRQQNNSRGVESTTIRQEIQTIVAGVVHE